LQTRRGHYIADNSVKYGSAGPVSYEEIVSFPEGKTDIRWFDIENLKIDGKNSNTVQVDFNESNDEDAPSNIIYTAKLSPDDTSFMSESLEINTSCTIHRSVQI